MQLFINLCFSDSGYRDTPLTTTLFSGPQSVGITRFDCIFENVREARFLSTFLMLYGFTSLQFFDITKILQTALRRITGCWAIDSFLQYFDVENMDNVLYLSNDFEKHRFCVVMLIQVPFSIPRCHPGMFGSWEFTSLLNGLPESVSLIKR